MKQLLTLAIVIGIGALTFIITRTAQAQPDPSAFALSSPEFTDGGVINVAHSCDGAGTSPPLHWENVPEHTAGFVVTIDDPDAPSGDFTHWLLYNIPAKTRDLTAGITFADTTRSGLNSSGKTGYAPVCPPNGEHHYVIRVYAFERQPRFAERHDG